jgi:M6 family metalloprotease-like protein
MPATGPGWILRRLLGGLEGVVFASSRAGGEPRAKVRLGAARLGVVWIAAALALFCPKTSVATPSKALLTDPSGYAASALARAEAQARKWGMDVPDPAFAFDAARYKTGVARRNALVILIDFSDNPGSFVPGNFEGLLFSKGTYSTGSMRDYYLENSYGLLDVQGQVVGWVRSEKSYAYYVDNNYGLNFSNGDRNARGMAEEALRLVDPFVDFSAFDNDGPDGIPSSGDDDGYVDALMIVHAGRGAEETGSPADIRSHQSYFTNDQVYDGVRAILYTTEPEDGRVGVFAHEFGHTLGLPDLYDLSGGTGAGLGNWSLMATGVWLNNARTPAHLDAWSKAFLGFVEPQTPGANAVGVTLPPAEEQAAAYKIWTNGRPGKEYFLAERRERQGFDASLPGQGMLIYHVDESVRLQDDLNHYKVALMQADGLRQLELKSGNNGDSGDPFPGAKVNRFFASSSNPSSRAYDGSDTQVSITDITDEGGATVFDLQVETEPEFILTGLVLEEVQGDGDGRVEAGERGIVTAEVTNVGLDASGVQVDVEALSSEVTIESGAISVGEVRADSSFQAGISFLLHSGVVENPIELGFVMEVSAEPAKVWDISFAVGGGDITDFADDFEDGGNWSHGPVTEGRADAWALTTARSHSGSHSWVFGGEEGYPNSADGALTSPPILLNPGSQLSFFYWVSAESLGSSAAWDGGRVEISHNGGAWEGLEPVDGYPFTVLEFGDTPLAQAGVFSGSRDWKKVVCDLSPFTGLVRLRFRFVSDSSIHLEGWYIDDVVVTSRGYVASLRDVRETDGAVEVEIEVSHLSGPFEGAGFNIYRKTDGETPPPRPTVVPPDFTLLNEEPLLPDALGLISYLDEDVRRGRAYYYLVEDLGPASGGNALYLGPERIYLCLGRSQPSLEAAFPNPFRPGQGRTANLLLVLPDPGCAEETSRVDVRILDVTGRIVKAFPIETPPCCIREIAWDGTDSDGKVVASGVYLWRVQVAGKVFGRKTIVVK